MVVDDLFAVSAGEAQLICGTDEAGRGPLAGAVYAAAVILDTPIIGLNDSKKLSAKTRERLSEEIKSQARAWCIASASVAEIDELNILQASLLAMTRAVEGLSVKADWVWVDGKHFPKQLLQKGYAGQALVGGDALQSSISAASILAKVARDLDCLRLDALYPQYGFAQHKGYPTAVHLAALKAHGVCPEHRRSYAPVRAILERTC
ncbi:ribonuclease HII [Hydromonas duriensis]|nr:ribonuclease HII [Hydromonas duriensis]